LDGTPQLVVCPDGITSLEKNINTRKRNTKAMLGASKEVGLEVTAENVKYLLMLCHQNAGQTRSMKTNSFEKFVYLVMA
jgi:hypothetical protein